MTATYPQPWRGDVLLLDPGNVAHNALAAAITELDSTERQLAEAIDLVSRIADRCGVALSNDLSMNSLGEFQGAPHTADMLMARRAAQLTEVGRLAAVADINLSAVSV